MPAASPCTVRQAISTSSDGARAHAAEARVNTAMPITKTRRRPRRSPSTPASGIAAASAKRYESTVQRSVAGVVRRSFWIVGSATFTIVESSLYNATAAHSGSRDHHGLRVGSDCTG